MPILNYTTKVPASRTVAQIQEILAAKGASRVSVDYQSGKAYAVTFGFKIGNCEIGFKLPCNIAGVTQALKKSNARGNAWRDSAQVERIAWRIVKDWVEAQIALVEANQAELGEVFLPYAVHNDGQTFFQYFKSTQLPLTSGGKHAG